MDEVYGTIAKVGREGERERRGLRGELFAD